MIGVGIDAVEIGRFREILARHPRIRERLFSGAERSLLETRSDPVPSFAARFAAKEATMKAMRTGIGGVDFNEIEVLPDPDGAPHLWVSGRAAARAATFGITTWHVSLSHTATLATAIVVAS